MKVLAVNAGSSSIKSALFEEGRREPLWKSNFETLQQLLGALPSGVDAVGHRIVHGGRSFVEPTRITPEVKRALGRLASFAPAHNRLELDLIEAVQRKLGDTIPQVAVFDTAFHATLPAAAYTYAGPYDWLEQGIRRYGFHGISHQYVSQRAAEILGAPPERMVTCHLGNGCSLAAIRRGESIDTTMGFTPLEGLMMGTRSGSVDPGILIHLVRHCGKSADDLDRILNKESGLKGLSGVSGDMRSVQAAGSDRAKLALDVFVHRLRGGIGQMMASLGGLDVLVFTGGIGEHSPEIRDAATAPFGFLKPRVLVIPTDEEWQIAQHVSQALSTG
jgi:acetate kinase